MNINYQAALATFLISWGLCGLLASLYWHGDVYGTGDIIKQSARSWLMLLPACAMLGIGIGIAAAM